MSVRVAFQGELGAYSEVAIAQLFLEYEPIPCRTFRDVVERVLKGEADYGCLPVENSTTGAITESQELLDKFARQIALYEEVRLRVQHCLLGIPGSSLEKIRVISSHPQALAQCQRFLADIHVTVEPFYDTAGAARQVAQLGDPARAAIASRDAARRYNLAILREGIESDPNNTTRFVLFRKALQPWLRFPLGNDSWCRDRDPLTTAAHHAIIRPLKEAIAMLHIARRWNMLSFVFASFFFGAARP